MKFYPYYGWELERDNLKWGPIYWDICNIAFVQRPFFLVNHLWSFRMNYIKLLQFHSLLLHDSREAVRDPVWCSYLFNCCLLSSNKEKESERSGTGIAPPGNLLARTSSIVPFKPGNAVPSCDRKWGELGLESLTDETNNNHNF